jgi:hypothetical protein
MSTFKTVATTALMSLLLQARAFAVSNEAPITVGSSDARGSFHAASSSGDHTQYLTCGLSASSDPSAPISLSCSASDSNGKYYVCSAQNPSEAWIKMVAHLNKNSWIAFAGDAEGRCHSLTVQ